MVSSAMVKVSATTEQCLVCFIFTVLTGSLAKRLSFKQWVRDMSHRYHSASQLLITLTGGWSAVWYCSPSAKWTLQETRFKWNDALLSEEDKEGKKSVFSCEDLCASVNPDLTNMVPTVFLPSRETHGSDETEQWRAVRFVAGDAQSQIYKGLVSYLISTFFIQT